MQTYTHLPHDIHIWRIDLNQPADEVAQLKQYLSADELQRFERLISPELCRRAIVARGYLRRILAAYLGISAADVNFKYGPHGKPQLDLAQPLYFNLSHSHELALLAVTGLCEVGIDLEQIRPDIEALSIAEQNFSRHEAETLRQLPVAEQTLAFFRCWTRKEAFIKATGLGLTLPLDQFDVSLDLPPLLQCTAWAPDEAALWSLHELEIDPNFVASLAVQAKGFKVCCWDAATINESPSDCHCP